MPRLTNRPPRMCRDRHQAYVKIEGQRVQLGRWGTAKAREAYDRTIAEWLINGRSMPDATGDTNEPAPVAEVLVAYVKWARRRYAKSEADTIEAAVRKVRHLYGSTPADEFGPKRLRVARQAMVDAGWSRSHINKQVSRIRQTFKWGASEELCSERVHRRLATLAALARGEARERDPVKPVPRADVRRIRRHLPRQVRALIDLQLLTGARADELVRIKATDFDRRGDVWTVVLDEHKTAHHGKARTLYFGPKARRIVGLFLVPDRALDKPLFSPREAHAGSKRKDGAKGRRVNQKPTPRKTERVMADHYTTASYRRAIHRACEKSGADKWGPHRLRHNAGTELRREFGIEVASIVLGHSSLAITQTYAEQNHKRALEVMGQVG